MKFLQRKKDSCKGENGRVLVIGGSEDFIGAPYLTGMAALRSGADIVVVGAPEKTAWSINSLSPDLITKKFEGDFFNWDNIKNVIYYTEKFDVLIIGNGLGTEASTQDFVKEVVERVSIPKVIDADAIKALHKADIDNAIITPHKKEFEILTREILPKEDEKKIHLLQHYAKQRLVYLIKGEKDLIINKNQYRINKTGNSGMTIAGTGDVLAGLCGGFLAQSKNLFESAYNAAYINGKIGDYLLKKKGIGYIASDFLPLIPEFCKKIR